MPISSGSFTVGTGGDYADFYAAFQDVAPGGLTGDLTFTLISSCNDSGIVNYNEGAPFLANGFKIHIKSDNSPAGNVLGGYFWNVVPTILRFWINAGEVEIEGQRWQDRDIHIAANIGSGGSVKVHDNVLFRTGVGPGFLEQDTLSINITNGLCHLYNNMVVNGTNSIGQHCIGVEFEADSTDAEIRIYNNVAFPRAGEVDGFLWTRSLLNFTDIYIANNIAYDPSGLRNCFEYNLGTPSPEFLAGCYNNAVTDSTLTGTNDPIENFIPATEFLSIDTFDPDFLRIDEISQFSNSGYLPNNPSTQDVEGTPYGLTPPIGVFMSAGVIPPPTPPTVLERNAEILLRGYKHLLPNGRAFDITNPNKQIRQYYDANSATWAENKKFFDDVWLDIFPQTTRQIEQWEEQFNLQNGENLTEQERRDRLAAAWAAQGGQSPRYLQDTIQANGFDLYVHEFWELPKTYPPVVRNPNDYITNNGSDPTKGYLLVNKLTETGTDLIMVAGDTIAEAGEPLAEAGQFSNFVFRRVVYDIPVDPATWPYFLYFGAETFPNKVSLPAARRDEFETLIRKITPYQQWLGLLIDWV